MIRVAVSRRRRAHGRGGVRGGRARPRTWSSPAGRTRRSDASWPRCWTAPTWSSTSPRRRRRPTNVRAVPGRRRPRGGRHHRVRPRAARADAEAAARDGRRARCSWRPNFAIGAVLMMQMARQAAPHMPECEIVELHHDRKLDAPSGTAKRTAELIRGGRRQRPRADPLGAPSRPGRAPGGDLRRRGPDALDPPRLDRPPLVHAGRPARRAQRRRAARPAHGRARDPA